MFGWKKKYNEMVIAYDALQTRHKDTQLQCANLLKRCQQMEEQLNEARLKRSAAARKAARTRRANKEKAHE